MVASSFARQPPASIDISNTAHRLDLQYQKLLSSGKQRKHEKKLPRLPEGLVQMSLRNTGSFWCVIRSIHFIKILKSVRMIHNQGN
jgi:hypothetical protein